MTVTKASGRSRMCPPSYEFRLACRRFGRQATGSLVRRSSQRVSEIRPQFLRISSLLPAHIGAERSGGSFGCRRVDGQGEPDHRTRADLAFRTDSTAVCLDNAFCDVEAESRAAARAVLSPVLLEHMRELVARNSGSGVLHGKPDVGTQALNDQRRRAARRCELDRVVNEIREYAADQTSVARHGRDTANVGAQLE